MDCSDIAIVSYTQIATEFEAAKEQFPAQLRAMILDLVKDIEVRQLISYAPQPFTLSLSLSVYRMHSISKR